MERGEPDKIPQALHERPVLDDFQARLYEAWQLLSIGRPVLVTLGGGYPMPLPTGEIVAVAHASGFDTMGFLRLCRALDGIYLKRRAT